MDSLSEKNVFYCVHYNHIYIFHSWIYNMKVNIIFNFFYYFQISPKFDIGYSEGDGDGQRVLDDMYELLL